MESEGCRDGAEAERVEARGITEDSRAQSDSSVRESACYSQLERNVAAFPSPSINRCNCA